MLSEVTIDLSGRMFTMTGADLLLLLVAVFVISVVLVMSFSRGRRPEAAHSRSADILIVQLERIGDTLDQMVAQNTAVLAALKEKPLQAPRAAPMAMVLASPARSDLAIVAPEPTPFSPGDSPREQPSDSLAGLPDDSLLSEPVRSVISMLRP